MPPVRLRLNQCEIQRRCVKRGTARAIGPASCTTYIPDMSCDDPKRARPHRQRQAAYEARQRETGCRSPLIHRYMSAA